MGNTSAARMNRVPLRRLAADKMHANNADSMANAGPGWYYDPDDQAIYRYWDGAQWTDHRSDTVLSEIPS